MNVVEKREAKKRLEAFVMREPRTAGIPGWDVTQMAPGPNTLSSKVTGKRRVDVYNWCKKREKICQTEDSHHWMNSTLSFRRCHCQNREGHASQLLGTRHWLEGRDLGPETVEKLRVKSNGDRNNNSMREIKIIIYTINITKQ